MLEPVSRVGTSVLVSFPGTLALVWLVAAVADVELRDEAALESGTCTTVCVQLAPTCVVVSNVTTLALLSGTITTALVG